MVPANNRFGPRRQRGVAAVFTAVALVTLLSAVTLAIDVGRLYNSQRQLQRLADLAAIDGARVRSQCLGSANAEDVAAEVLASLARNSKPAEVSSRLLFGLRKPGANGLQFFQPVAEGDRSDSVQVTLTRQTPARILPLFAGDQSRTLTARAAAQGKSSVIIPPPRMALLDPDPSFSNSITSGLLNANVSFTGNQLRASAEATVDGTTLIDADQTLGLPSLPDVDVPQPAQGLLNALLAALDAAGDQATADTVRIFGDALRTGRGAVDILPADVLGLSPGQTYDDTTIPVADLLNNIAATVSGGEPFTFPIVLPPPLGDGVTITVKPGRPGTTGSFTPGITLNTTQSDDAAFASASFLRIDVRLLNPITGAPFTLPIYTNIQPARARLLDLSCARLGQADGHRVEVEAQATSATFAIGRIDNFPDSANTPPPSLAGLPPVPLFPLQLLGQTVTISTQLSPVTIGDDRVREFCFSGPPFGRAVQCNGAPAEVGGASTNAPAVLADALTQMRLQATLPPNLSPLLRVPLQSAVDDALVTINAALAPQLALLTQELVPRLQSVGLSAGAEAVRVTSVKVVQPVVYAQ